MRLALARLGSAAIGAGTVLAALARARGGLKARFGSALNDSAGQRGLLAGLRLARPRLGLSRNLVGCYPGTGSLILTRAADVDAALTREADFAVVYAPRMRAITGGRDFFLGMQDGPDYRRDVAASRALIAPGVIDGTVLPMARAAAIAAVDRATAAGARLDLPPGLTAAVPALLVQRWFGLAETPAAALIDDTTAMFHYLFADLQCQPWVADAATAAAERLRAAIESACVAPAPDTLIGRAVAARDAGEPAFAGTGVRDTMLGLVTGAIATLNKAACFALDELLRRPEALAAAAAAARGGDTPVVAAHIFEALRFNPVSPILYRRAVADTRLGRRRVARDTMLLVATLSAMHDEAAVARPRAFRADRPWADYMLWGRGTHLCFGDRLNQTALPAVLEPLLARPGLRRAAGSAGRPSGLLDGRDTPFPRHFTVEWDG